MRIGTVAVLIVLCGALVDGAKAQTPGPARSDRAITHLRGALYQVRDGRQHTVFVATREGIVLGDPLSGATAEWLQAELASRFPEIPIRFVLVTSHVYARAEGLAVFAEEAELVAQEQYSDALDRARGEFTGTLATLDRDGDGALEAAELAASIDRASLVERDRNRDGRLTPRELYSRVSDVERRFDRQWHASLDGVRVEMVHVGAAHAPEMSILVFPNERVVFAADTPPLTLQDGFGAFAPRDALAWARVVDGLDFDTLLTSDGRSIPHADVSAFHRYVAALLDVVADGHEAGRTAATLQPNAKLDAYRNTPFYAGRQAQIAAAYADLRLTTVDLYGAAMGRLVLTDPQSCPTVATCDHTSRVGAVTVGLRTNVGRIGLVGEAMFGAHQRETARSTAWSLEHLAHRDTRGSVLASFGSSSGGLDLSALAGFSFTVTDTSGLVVARGAIAPVSGGRRAVSFRDHQAGVTVGADVTIAMGRRFALMAPVRYTRSAIISGPGGGVEPHDLQIGLGLSMRVSSRVRRPD